MITEHQIHFKTGQRSKKLSSGKANAAIAERVPRVAKLMALAIKFEQMILDGIVKDQADLARLGLVTRARMSQIMSLLNLSPQIQEELLHLAAFDRGAKQPTLAELRSIAMHICWKEQRATWNSRD